MSPPAGDTDAYSWASVDLIAHVHGHQHVIVVRCVVIVRADSPRAVMVPWWRSWALVQHGPFSAS